MSRRSPLRRLRSALLPVAVVAVAGLGPTGGRGAAGAEPAARADLSGEWALVEGLSHEPAAKAVSVAREAGGASSAAPGGRGGAGGGAEDPGLDLPLEVLADASRIVVEDGASSVRVTYPSGRKRTFFTDGEERELDDGDGPAKVVAKRSGTRGERIALSTKWPSKRSLKETWVLLESPRRLTVEGKADGRDSFRYRRTYEPAPPRAPAPKGAAPAPSAVPSRSATPATPPATPSDAAPAPDVSRTDCSIRPPKGTRAEELRRLATITGAEAERKAVASVAPLKVSSVISSDAEVDEGCLVFPFALRLEGRRGVREVLIDAGDGKVIISRFESLDAPAADPR